MTARFLEWLRRRWEVAVDPADPIPFQQLRSQINLRRLELLAWFALANEVCQAIFAVVIGFLPYLSLVATNTAIDIMVIVAARWVRARGSVRLQGLLAPVTVTLMLLMTQASIAVIATTGRVSSSYPLVLLGIALLFVLPLRVLASMMAGTFITYVIVVWQMPVPALERLGTIRLAAFSAVVATITGTLIHTARERDHEQKLAIYERNLTLSRRNQEMDEVMAFAAHDLRSPLLGLRNLIDFTIPRTTADPEMAVEILQEASRSLGTTLGLISRLLAAHEAEYGPLDSAGGGDLRHVLIAAAERNRPQARGTGIPLQLDLPAQAVLAHYDAGALERIVDNLISNAVRFTPAGRKVTLRCWHEAGHALLSVEDEGPGIPEAERPHLFDKFRRGQTSAGSGPAGAGLGLFIVSMLTERIGGRIVYRPAEPRGSIFQVSLDGMRPSA